jgi:hypothetical protein
MTLFRLLPLDAVVYGGATDYREPRAPRVGGGSMRRLPAVRVAVASAGLGVVSEKGGVWGQAQSLPGTVPLDPKFNQAAITGMSCLAPGQCSAAGFHGSDLNAENVSIPFVATQVNGTWGAAQQVPGLAALNLGNQRAITSVWCGTPGNCAAGGFYTGPGGSAFHSDVPDQAFLTSETGGVWGRAIPVPGLAALGSRASGIAFVFCGRTGKCVAVGATRRAPDS